MKQFIITIVILIFFVSSSCAQKKKDDETIQRINNYLLELEKIGFDGSILFELNGEKIISNGYGYSNKESKLKNSSATIFDIGSVTKQFTAAAIIKLEMHGKLSTEDKLSKYFNDIPEDKEVITIHDLLRHQSGLISNVGKDYEKIDKEGFLSKVLSSDLRFEVGSDFSYSNIGYSLLAIIIEKVSGQSYETYLYENLWEPSGMEMTGYTRPKYDANLIAVGYGKNNMVWGRPNEKGWDEDAPYWNLKGNGGILSTTEDFYKWHKALMGNQILSKEAKHKLYHPTIRTNETYDAIYAYGWDVSRTERNTLRVWHNGTNNIFYADFMRFIDEGVTLIMMSNKSNRDLDQLNFEVAKIIFEKGYEPIIPVADNKTNQLLSHVIIETVLSKGLEKAKSEYESRPSKADILENILNTKGYELLSQNKYDEAISIFTMNTIAYPKSFNAFDSLGEAYMNKGDKISAIKNYEKSLQLNSTNGNAIEMLKKLKTQ